MEILKKALKNKNLKAGSLYLFGNIFNKAIGFITVPIFTRMMSSSDYGVVNTYLSWVSILSVIVGLSLGNSIRSAYTEYKDELDDYIFSIFILAILNFIFVIGVVLLISIFYKNQLDVILVGLCLIQSFMTFIINTMIILYMMDLEYVKRTLLLAVPNVIIAVLSIVLISIIDENKYLGRIIPYVFITTIIGLYFLIKYFIKSKKKLNTKYWKYALILSLPLVFHGLSINVLSTSDRTMITLFRSTSETGVYSLVYSFSMIATVVTSSLESVWIPWFTRKMQNNEISIINKNVKLYIEIVVISVIVILMISPEILVLLAPKEYWSGKSIIPFILFSSFFIFLYSISVNLEYYYQSTKIIAVNTMIAALVNITLNMLFIPKYGIIAAASTTLIAYFVSFIIHYFAARKLNSDLFPFKIYLMPIIIIIISILIFFAFMDSAIIRWSITLIGFVIYFWISIKNNRFNFILNK